MKQSRGELPTIFGTVNQLSVQYASQDGGRLLLNDASEVSLTPSKMRNNRGKLNESHHSLGIQMGNNRVGYQQIKEAMRQEKQGLKKDLMGHLPLVWTLKDQLDAQNKKRKTAFSKMDRKTAFFKSGAPQAAKTHTNLLKIGDMKQYNSDYEDLGVQTQTANTMMKVNKAGIAQLFKTNTKLNLANYSVTTQGLQQEQVFRTGHSLTGFKIPVMVDLTLRNQLAKQQSFEELHYKHSVPIERKLYEIQKNANIKTSEKRQQPSQADLNFRAYVDNQVDLLGRLSTNTILKRLSDNN